MHEFEEGFRYLDKLINSSEQLNSFLHANEEDCIAAIKNQNPICSTINIIKAKKKKQFFEIQKRQVLSTVHPLFKGLIPQQTQCVSIKENIQYISKILPDSDFDLSNIDSFIIENSKNNYTITFTQASKWEKKVFVKSSPQQEKHKKQGYNKSSVNSSPLFLAFLCQSFRILFVAVLLFFLRGSFVSSVATTLSTQTLFQGCFAFFNWVSTVAYCLARLLSPQATCLSCFL